MTKKRSTKRALLLSFLSLLMCVSMLIGSTYAWFTDSVTSANNVIKSGTLDVEMYWANGTENPEAATWADASKTAIFDYELWEPGYVQVRHVKIENKGSLAFKFQLNIAANGEVSKLADVIDVYFADPATQIGGRADLSKATRIGTLTEVLAGMPANTSGELTAGDNATVTIALKMQETAGNEYQNLSIGSDFSVQVLATQLTSEKDSFDIQYDKMATVDNEDELKAALASDADTILIELGANVELTDSLVIPADKEVTIDLRGFTMSQEKAQTAAYAMVDNKGTLNVKDSFGGGEISYADTTVYTADNGYASNTISNTGVLNVYGGTIENVSSDNVKSYGYPHAIDAYQGSVTNIYGGTVKSVNYDSIRMFCNSNSLATTVNISGGTIYNRVTFQNPNNNTNITGYGRLNISGGNFVTTENINANVRLLQFAIDASNMKATITGGTFDKGIGVSNYTSAAVVDKWMTVSGGTFGADPSAYVADGMKAVQVGSMYEIIADTTNYATASTAAELQAALDNAANVNLIVLTADITGDVVVKQISNLVITVNGDGHKFAGVFLVDGNSATEMTSGITLKNINFVAESVSADACVQLGNGTNVTRYTCNVTVDNCTFDVPGVVGVKSYTGGDKNLQIINCTATERAHSLAQLKGIDGVLVEKCTVNAVRGINFNNSLNITVKNSTIDVQKYALRFGESDNTIVEDYKVIDCTIKSQNVDNDAAIVLRAGALNANLTITNTTITAGTKLSGDDNANVVIN